MSHFIVETIMPHLENKELHSRGQNALLFSEQGNMRHFIEGTIMPNFCQKAGKSKGTHS